MVLPLATGGTTAHVLAIDYALRPVLSSLGSAQIVQGYFLLDRDITRDQNGRAVLAAESRTGLDRAVDRFAGALALHHGEGSERAEGYALTAA